MSKLNEAIWMVRDHYGLRRLARKADMPTPDRLIGKAWYQVDFGSEYSGGGRVYLTATPDEAIAMALSRERGPLSPDDYIWVTDVSREPITIEDPAVTESRHRSRIIPRLW